MTKACKLTNNTLKLKYKKYYFYYIFLQSGTVFKTDINQFSHINNVKIITGNYIHAYIL